MVSSSAHEDLIRSTVPSRGVPLQNSCRMDTEVAVTNTTKLKLNIHFNNIVYSVQLSTIEWIPENNTVGFNTSTIESGNVLNTDEDALDFHLVCYHIL